MYLRFVLILFFGLIIVSSTSNTSLFYRDTGVDIDIGIALVNAIKPFSEYTKRKGVLSNIGGFSALFEISKKFKEPLLVSSTDGVGTKLKLASYLNCHDTIGIDLVAMSVNDILVHGAEPLFFQDYFSCSKLVLSVATNVIKGIAKGCKLAGCALIGGETAEMPNMYLNHEYDLAGFVVGVVEKSKLIDGMSIIPGDVILGLASSGLHSNGYSLVRKILDIIQPNFNADFYERRLADVLLEPTRIYVKSLLALMAIMEIKGLAHITGGGLIENIPRVLQDHLFAVLYRDSWNMPPLFSWLQKHGKLIDIEMYRVFNCGIGMIIIVSAENVNAAITQLQSTGESVIRIGEIRERRTGETKKIVII